MLASRRYHASLLRSLTTVAQFLGAFVIFLVTLGLQQYIITIQNCSYGLFGATLAGEYHSYLVWPVFCVTGCDTLHQFYNAGATASAFQILALIPFIVVVTFSILEMFNIKPLSNILDGKIPLYSAVATTGLIIFSWILWQVIRPYSVQNTFGFCYHGLLIVVALTLLGTIFCVFEENKQGNSGKGGYISIEEHSSGESSEIPEGSFEVRNILLFTSWQTPICVRILYYLSMIIALAQWMSYMANAPDTILRAGFFRRLLYGFMFSVLFVGAVRIFGELAMKLLVHKRVLSASSPSNNNGSVSESKVKEENQKGDYKDSDLFVHEENVQNNQTEDEIVEEKQEKETPQSYQEIN